MFGGTWSRTAIQTTQLSIFLPKWTTIRGLEGPGFGLCPCFCEWNVSTGPSLPLHPERPDGFVQERGIAAYWTSTCQCKWVYWWHWWSTLSFWSTATPKKREKQNPAYRILYSRLVANYMSIFLEFVWVQLPRRNGAFNESSICRTGGRLSQWWKMSLFTGLLQPTIVGRGKWAILPLYIYIFIHFTPLCTWGVGSPVSFQCCAWDHLQLQGRWRDFETRRRRSNWGWAGAVGPTAIEGHQDSPNYWLLRYSKTLCEWQKKHRVFWMIRAGDQKWMIWAGLGDCGWESSPQTKRVLFSRAWQCYQWILAEHCFFQSDRTQRKSHGKAMPDGPMVEFTTTFVDKNAREIRWATSGATGNPWYLGCEVNLVPEIWPQIIQCSARCVDRGCNPTPLASINHHENPIPLRVNAWFSTNNIHQYPSISINIH
jgi:hypothetical protein